MIHLEKKSICHYIKITAQSDLLITYSKVLSLEHVSAHHQQYYYIRHP